MNEKDLAIIGDSEYIQMLEKIKKSYKDKQLKAAVSVNSEMLKFYYSLGEEIISLKAESRWGSGFYKKLSSDLQNEIPNVKGFSVTNLKYMKKFYEIYSPLNRPQPVDDLQLSKVSRDFDMIFSIPWGHQRYIMDRCEGNLNKALFFISKTIENGWSRAVLLNFLDTDLFDRQGKAITNFT
ncbi:TPA: DUF1016 domain-containing protein, partial [Streptococcus equi subsp. zooepidemicus]|nr:DUF1016 domain-containing protein [Streptococcus equi subsp. zooepidemicus]